MSSAFIYSLRQLFAACGELFTDELGRRGVLALASCCRETHASIRPYIEQRYVFRIPRWDHGPFRQYQPRVIRLDFEYPQVKGADSVTRTDRTDRCLPALGHFPLVQEVIFGPRFDAPVDHLPETITRLTFGASFNQPIDRLPAGLTHLKLGYSFDRSSASLPKGLKWLVFGTSYDHPVDCLPPGLMHLDLGECFAQSVDNLPPRVTHLALGQMFDGSLSSLPEGLTHLTLWGLCPSRVRSLPRSLACLEIVHDKHGFAQVAKDAKSIWDVRDHGLVIVRRGQRTTRILFGRRPMTTGDFGKRKRSTEDTDGTNPKRP